MVSFWKWVFCGARQGPAGLRNVVNWHLFLHVILAYLAVKFIKSDPFDFAAKALFPAASILVGMSLAWTTRAATILQSGDLRDALFQENRPAEDYVYSFQFAILIIIIMVVYVSIMAGGGLDISVFHPRADRWISGYFLYFLLSLSLRECWGVVNFTNMLSILEYSRSKNDI